MAETLIRRWLGESIDDIANSYREPVQPEDVLEWMKDEKTKLAHEIVKGIVKRAHGGDLQAVEWLVRRKFLGPEFASTEEARAIDLNKTSSLSDFPSGYSTRDGC